MRAIWHEIRMTLSQLRHSPGFTVVAAGILALGLGVTVYMFTAVKGYLLTPLPYPGAERIMHIERANPLHGSEVAIVNETFARRVFGSVDVVGRDIGLPLGDGPRVQSRPVVQYRIVGTAADIRNAGLRSPARLEVLVPMTALHYE